MAYAKKRYSARRAKVEKVIESLSDIQIIGRTVKQQDIHLITVDAATEHSAVTRTDVIEAVANTVEETEAIAELAADGISLEPVSAPADPEALQELIDAAQEQSQDVTVATIEGEDESMGGGDAPEAAEAAEKPLKATKAKRSVK